MAKLYCFPYPQGSDVDPLRAPYMAREIYSLAGPYTFHSYFNDVQSRDSPLECSLASIVQTWLYFGLASEALGRDITHDEFIERGTDGTSKAFIDLRMPSWFGVELKTRWSNLETNLSKNEYEKKRGELQRTFELAHHSVDSMDLSDNDPDMDLSIVLLSVRLLLFLIATRIGPISLAQTNLRCRSCKVLIQRMLKNGWCRKRLNFIEFVPVSHPSMYFMSSFRPTHSLKENHQSCTAAKCCITTGLTQPLHRTPDCQCQDIHVPLEQVAKIVAAGGIPLVRIERPSSGGLTLKVVPYRRTSLFTAVSHVWADRQFGSTTNALPRCQVEYLDSMLAALPLQTEHSGLSRWVWLKKANPSGTIKPPVYSYQLFWLDTFCIPQDTQHADLKRKAIDSMNLIYAAAWQTIVFDASLQKFDAGKRPNSLIRGIRGEDASFYSPACHNLPDVLAQICASNWMGRAWTLQEGVLSRNLVFPLDGSLAYLKFLYPESAEGVLTSEIPYLQEFSKNYQARKRVGAPLTPKKDEVEPFRECIREDLFRFVNDALNVKEYQDYARGSADRSARFVKTHSLLQARSTTQLEDLPLIMINMSGMNGNSISQSKSSDERMKLLFYGLETIPVELLYSDCARINGCTVDSWIPLEVTPEMFSRERTMQLGPEGFTFHCIDGSDRSKFFLVPPSTVWHNEVLLSWSANRGNTKVKFLLKSLTSSTTQTPTASDNGWCLLFEDREFDSRGARFVVSRIEGNKVFLHFDCPLQLSSCDIESTAITEELLSNVCVAKAADPQQEFIIEKSSTPQYLGMSRPQNPAQYSGRIKEFSRALSHHVGFLENYFLERYLSDAVSKSPAYFIVWSWISAGQRDWIDRALHAFVHHAWARTYRPTWNPNGPWKWFWKMLNSDLPIGYVTTWKYWCRFIFFWYVSKKYRIHTWVMTRYYYTTFPNSGKDLRRMYMAVLAWKFFSYLYGKVFPSR